MNITPSEFGYAVFVLIIIGVIIERMGFKFRRLKDPENGKSKTGCDFGNALKECVNTVKRKQDVNVNKLEEHSKDLEQGQKDFHDIRAKISNIEIAVGVLLDRTGGRPDGWRANHVT